MNFISLLRPYMKIFYLLGQTLYPLDFYLWNPREKLSQWQRLALICPTIFTFVLKLVLCAACFSMVHIFGESLGITNDSITDLFLFCELLKAIAVLHQNLTNDDLLVDIMRSYQTVEFLFRSTLNYPIQYTLFHRAYTRKAGWAFGSYTVLLFLFSIYYHIYGEIDVTDVMIKVMQFISISVYMHMLFFIDFVTFYLHHLNTIIGKESSDYQTGNVCVIKMMRTPEAVRKLLSKFKFIHYCLWKVTQQLNQLFGWTLIAFMLQAFFEFVYITKWQLRTFSEDWSFINLSRTSIYQVCGNTSRPN